MIESNAPRPRTATRRSLRRDAARERHRHDVRLAGSTEAPLLEALAPTADPLRPHPSGKRHGRDGRRLRARVRRIGFVGLHTSVGTMNGLSQLYGSYRDGTPVVVTAGHKDSGVLAATGFARSTICPVSHAASRSSRRRASPRPTS